jgi:prevent-host-death family protein
MTVNFPSVTAPSARAHCGKLLDRVADDRGSFVIEKRGTPKAVIAPISLDGTASCHLILLRGEHPFTDFRQFRRKRLVEVCPAA